MDIESEASVKVAIEILADDDVKKKWMYQSFYNMSWDNRQCILSHCGIQGINSFDSLLNCPFLNCYAISNKKQETVKYLAEGYSLILPISTERIGINGKNFSHNIFVKAKADDTNVVVYDFWAPRFIWEKKRWDIQKIINGITENAAEHEYPIACKIKEGGLEVFSPSKVDLFVNSYIRGRDGHGIDFYEGIKKWVENMETPYTLNHVNFVTMKEHFEVWKELLCENDMSNHIEDLISKTTALRNLSMKLWYSKRVKPDWKEGLIQKLTEIQVLEKQLLTKIIDRSEN